MPMPRVVARFNRRVTNHILGPLAGVIPPFAQIEHRGRASGKKYSTTVWAFPSDGGYVIAMTYGPNTEWAQNVLAAGGCRIRTPSEEVPLGNARLVRGADGVAYMPVALRPALRVLGVTNFLLLDR